MPGHRRLDRLEVAALAPHGVARTADLVAAGMSSSTIAHRCRSGRWSRPAPGVVLLRSGDPSADERVFGALLYVGHGGVVTGAEAVRRHGLQRGGDAPVVDVLIPATNHRRSTSLVAVTRTTRVPAPVWRDEVPLAPPDRAVLDTARSFTDVDDVRALLAEVVQRRRTTVARLATELDAGCQRGSAVPRAVLGELGLGIRSVGEGWALSVHARSGLPAMMWNPVLLLPSGRALCTPDGWIDDVGFAWEIESPAHHPDGDRRTLARRAAYRRHGIVHAHHRPRELLEEPDQVIEDLWSFYRAACSRPRPAVRAVPVARRRDVG